MLISAQAFAAFLHRNQKYAGLPYDYHLAMVEQVVTNCHYSTTYMDYSPEHPLVVAAWLHDVVEDCLQWMKPQTRLRIIRMLYGVEVADLVWAVTGIGPNRKARNADIYSKLVDFPNGAILKCADRIANVEASLWDPGTYRPNQGMMRMYLKERRDFEAIVKHQVPPAMWARLERAFDRCQELVDIART